MGMIFVKKTAVSEGVSTLISIICLSLLSAQVFSQVATDADLVKKSDTEVTYTWYAQGLFWSIILVILVVLFSFFWNKRKRLNHKRQ